MCYSPVVAANEFKKKTPARTPIRALAAGGLLAVGLLIPTAARAAGAYEVTPLPEKRNLHGSVIVGDYLHVVSGDEPMPKGFTNSVLTAKINDDRSLGPWTPNRPLPVNLIYISNNVLVVNDSLYVVGGQEVSDIPGSKNPAEEYNHRPNNTALYARVAANGAIGEWKRSAPYPGVTGQGVAAVTSGRHLYALGGLKDPGDAPSNEVFCAPIFADGAVGAWSPGLALPTPLTNHSAYYHNGVIYTFGGRTTGDDNSITDKVYLSSVNDDGTLSPWVESPNKLAYKGEVASACAADDFLFLFCGRTSQSDVIKKIQYSRLTPTGITAWTPYDTNIEARMYASAALDMKRRAVYISGGRYSQNYANTNNKVYCFPLKASRRGEAAPAGSGVASPFLDFEQAKQLASTSGKRILAVAYSSDIEFSRQTLAGLSTSAPFLASTRDLVLARLDISQNQKVASEFGIYRVPSAVLFGPDAKVIRTKNGVKSVDELVAFAK